MTFTIGGKKGTSHFNMNFTVGASKRNSFGQVGLNMTLNLTDGGLGSVKGQREETRGSFVISPSLTLGGGTTQTEAPLNTFASNFSTSVTNNFYASVTHAQNLVFTKEGYQRVGAYGIKVGDVSLNIYNDTKIFVGDTEDRWFSGGGSVTISNFLGISSNFLTIGNDVFTGQSMNKSGYEILDVNEPTYTNKNGTFHYAGQSTFDPEEKTGYNQSLNMGQTFLRITNSEGIFQISHSGNWDMFSQDLIHDNQENFHRFLSTVPNQFNLSVGKNE